MKPRKRRIIRKEDITPEMLKNPYIKKCKYSLCGEFFEAARPDEDYCSDQHHNREKYARAKERNLMFKTPNRIIYINYLILKKLYLSGVRKISASELLKLGFYRLAYSLRAEDKIRGGYTKFYLDYGIRNISDELLEITYLKGAHLNTN